MNKTITVTSIEVANILNRRHYDLMKCIRKYVTQLDNPTDYFIEDTCTDAKGRIRFFYHITEAGCDFLSQRGSLRRRITLATWYTLKFKQLTAENEVLSTESIALTPAEVTAVALPKADNKQLQTISSLEVAEMVGKEHKNLIRDIRKYVEQLGQSKIEPSDFFTESTYQNTQNKTQPCYLVTKKGCEFIAHKLTGQKGTEFTARYINRFHEMEGALAATAPSAIDTVVVNNAIQAISELTNTMKSMQKDIQSIKEEASEKKLPEKKSSYWKTNTFKKLNLIVDCLNEESDKQVTLSSVIHSTIVEMEKVYGLALNDYVEAYKSEHSSDVEPYVIDTIGYYKETKKKFTLTLDSILKKLGIEPPKQKNIFDDLAISL